MDDDAAMRVSEAALALITRVDAQGEMEYLSQWNEKWQAYALVGGHRENGESFRDCCLREIEEELALLRNVDFTIAAEPLVPRIEFTAFSKSAKQDSAYRIELFSTQLKQTPNVAAIGANTENRWLQAADIFRGSTSDGRAVAELTLKVLSTSQSLGQNMDAGLQPTVTWMDKARRNLSEAFRRQLDDELRQTFAPDRAVQIIVKQRFRGFSDQPDKKLIIAVETQGELGTHASVVKIGDVKEVSGDHNGWQSCATARGVASRMLIAPKIRHVSATRAAIIYPDVYQYYDDNGRDDEPKELEVIVEQCIRRNYPSAASVERVLTQVFTEAHRCFYRDAEEDVDGKRTRLGVTKSLRMGDSDPVLDRWRLPEFLQLRRGAVWLTCGSRKPESLNRPDYIDPVDYVDWAIEHGQFPRMLIGAAHGDLHGRNVIVGVVRGEAEWPAVFDFDKMANHNLVAWDFAKLEMELKCRLFQQLLATPKKQATIRKLLNIPIRQPLPADLGLKDAELRVQPRIDRMEIMFAIEKRLQSWTNQISSADQAARRGESFSPDVSANTSLGRAMRIIFRIRREAAIYLGFQRQGRESQWSDEYRFALATYGIVAAKWHSANDHMAWSLLSAGVAAANMTQLPWPPDPKIPPPNNSPTYLHLLPYSAKCWAEEDWAAPLPSLAAGIVKFPYAVPLKQQLALLQAESRVDADIEQSRRDIESIANLACVFRDHETLCRLGRFYKDRGDKQFNNKITCEEMILQSSPSFQYYLSSFKFYHRAYQVSGDYYPAVNAATLALLVGQRDTQLKLAQHTLDLCRIASLDGPDRAWVLATEGEASLLLGKTQNAVDFYRSALDAILPREIGVVQSIYDQLCRLHWALGAAVVQPVIDMLAKAGRLKDLKPGPFNNCGRT
jgi:hypothetical protein